jgi:hypothetical protein
VEEKDLGGRLSSRSFSMGWQLSQRALVNVKQAREGKTLHSFASHPIQKTSEILFPEVNALWKSKDPDAYSEN